MFNRLEFSHTITKRLLNIFKSNTSRTFIRQFSKVLLPNKNKGPFQMSLENGMKININPKNDMGVELCLYYYGRYEAGTLHFIMNALGDGDTFLDIGANIGLMTLFASEKVGLSGQIHSFEALPEIGKELKANVELNHLKNVKVHQIALGDFEGETEIFLPTNGNKGMTSLVKTARHMPNGTKIHIRKLDSYDEFVNNGVDVIKIDVEGFETQVLKGAEKIFKVGRLPILVVEFDKELNSEPGNHLFDRIKALGGYEIYVSERSKEYISPFKQVYNKDVLTKHENLFCIPRQRREEMESRGVVLKP